jgi:hypothetical protein
LLAGRHTTSCCDGPSSGRIGNSKLASWKWRITALALRSSEARGTLQLNGTVAPGLLHRD